MKTIATTSEQMLETVLYRLQTSGWARVDFEKLVDAYMDFRSQARRCVYRLQSGPNLRDYMRAAVEADIVSLERKAQAMRTIGRRLAHPARPAASLLAQARTSPLRHAPQKRRQALPSPRGHAVRFF